VTIARLHCQVLEVPERDDWNPRSVRSRDLLPWADPYIATLIHRLEDRYNVDDAAESDCDPYAADAAAWQLAGDGWEDAFIPRSLDIPRRRWQSPVYGGFPLLDDAQSHDLAEDASADAI
jgi:hypothetical protein